MRRNSIPVNIWDDYWDDGIGKPQVTHAYVEDCDIPEADQSRMLAAVYDRLLTLDLKGVKLELKGSRLYFKGLTHARREQLVDELKATGLEFEGKPFFFYSES